MDRNLRIGIIGLGLIGGSIFKALCALQCNVFGVSKSNDTIEKALKYNYNVSNSLEILEICDIVFVCTPINQTLKILDTLDGILKPTTIVSDICSLKSFLTEKKRPYKLIPSHPMAGTEHKGFDNSFQTLFQGAKWILTPPDDVSKEDIAKVQGIIEVLGAIPIITTPTLHDEAAALISHMPMLLSQALFKTAKDNPLALKMAASGFRDMTRLALSNEEMAKDFIDYNSKNIQKALLYLYSSIGELLKSNYAGQIKEIKVARKQMYINGKNVL